MYVKKKKKKGIWIVLQQYKTTEIYVEKITEKNHTKY